MSIREPSKDELRTLWDTGVSLDSAWFKFSPTFDYNSLMALRIHPANDDTLGVKNPRYQELNKGWLPGTWEGRQTKLAIATSSARAYLLGEIYAGRLWAIGFLTLANGFDEPVRVPRQFFLINEGAEPAIHPDIDWGSEELKAGSNSYFDIRILRPPVSHNDELIDWNTIPRNVNDEPLEWIAGPENASNKSAEELQSKTASQLPSETAPTTLNPTRPIGRPNRSDAIRSKVRELWKTDEKFRGMPNRLDQAEEIRARMWGEDKRYFDKMPGHRTSTIIRIIGEVVNQPEESA
jgi:hypothetical protein